MKQKPNVLHLFVDQQRFDTIHALGNPVIRTPNLDRLVRSGIAFTDAYTPSPVCIAARCSMIHGQYPVHTGCCDNMAMPEDNRDTLMTALTRSGYRTHGIGKCHFAPDLYALRGFQTREIQEEGGFSALDRHPYLSYLYERGYHHLLEPHGIRGEMYYVPQPSQLPARDHPTQWIGDRSVRFIHEQADQNEPWYLFSSFIHPHPPFAPPNPWHKLYRPDQMPLPNLPDDFESLQTLVNRCQNRYKYRDNAFDLNLVRSIKAYYYACISFVDYQIGRILDELDRSGQTDRTLIIFTADHGEHLGDYQCFGKRSMHDSCSRIPLILSMPGLFAGGRVCHETASLIDLAPTILSVAGASIDTHPLDGVDLAQLAAGQSKRESVFSHNYFDGSAFLESDADFSSYIADRDNRFAVFSAYLAVNQNWKYIYSAPDNRAFLFDRKTDPKETRDFSCNPFLSDVRQQMNAQLVAYVKQNPSDRAVENDDFRAFRLPPFVRNPDAGHLIQDSYTPWSSALIPGYSDQMARGC